MNAATECELYILKSLAFQLANEEWLTQLLLDWFKIGKKFLFWISTLVSRTLVPR